MKESGIRKLPKNYYVVCADSGVYFLQVCFTKLLFHI